ncbi:MAG: NADPH:quinone oxidoreductase family protein [Gammaproteobacteria bacterium]
MRIVIGREFGPPESYAIEHRDPAPPGPGEVRIAVRAIGVSFVDVLTARGGYQVKPPLPFIPGSEFAGEVAQVGTDVTHLRPGDRVCAVGFGGVFAESVTVPAAGAVRIAPAMDFDAASVFLVSYGTAYHALVQRAGLRSGETVLVLGAGGAVGVAAMQVARALGARVIGSASTPAKRELVLAAGAHEVLDTQASDWRAQVKALTAGRGADVVVDPIGGAMTETAFRSLAWGGRHLVIGFASGSIGSVPANVALLKGAALVGVDIRQFLIHTPAVHADNVAALMRLHEQGHLAPVIGARFAFERYVDAMNAAYGGEVAGRVVLTVP